MSTSLIQIQALTELPSNIDAMAAEANEQGHNHVERLVSDFASGANRFNQPGECLLAARCNGELWGIGGLNLDPYGQNSRIGRIRRVYVRTSARRQGVASQLMHALETVALSTFNELQLRTTSIEAARFYSRLGYEAVQGIADVSHRKLLA